MLASPSDTPPPFSLPPALPPHHTTPGPGKCSRTHREGHLFDPQAVLEEHGAGFSVVDGASITGITFPAPRDLAETESRFPLEDGVALSVAPARTSGACGHPKNKAYLTMGCKVWGVPLAQAEGEGLLGLEPLQDTIPARSLVRRDRRTCAHRTLVDTATVNLSPATHSATAVSILSRASKRVTCNVR